MGQNKSFLIYKKNILFYLIIKTYILNSIKNFFTKKIANGRLQSYIALILKKQMEGKVSERQRRKERNGRFISYVSRTW